MYADAIIVGAGLAGAAAARALSRRGRAVIVLEAFEPGHSRGSSHGSARIFRRAYPDPFYVRLTGEAAELWRQIQDEAGEQLITMTGAIDFGPGTRPARLYEVMCALGIPAESLRPGQARERWPHIAFDSSDEIVYHSEAGALDAGRATAALCRLAAENGTDIRYQSPALRINPGTGTVVTDDSSFSAPVVIVAAGPWAGSLLRGHAELPELKVTQTQAFHFMAARAGSPVRWPAFIYHDGTPAAPSGVLSGADVPGAMKVGTLGVGNETTADGRDFRIDPVGRDAVVKFVQAKVPGLIPDPVGELSCLFTSTLSRNFILDRVGRLVIVSACSGHGAKFSPLIGEIVADLADGKPSRFARFAI
jgi:monomeric sarcosine oxidase